jgi:glycosyltransferase involved in cell wall biosynthesis
LTRSLSVIIPAYNEQSRLPETLKKLLRYFGGGAWQFLEIVIVDDGSTDGTVAVAQDFAAKAPAIRILRNPGNCGKGYSIRHGMLEARGEWALFTDADLSAPIEELDKLWSAADAGTPVVIGSRALNRSLVEVHQSIFRESAGKFFNLVMRIVLRLPLADTQCGFKLFAAEAARKIFTRQRLNRFGFDAEVLFIARKLGYQIAEVPVRWRNVEGSKVSLWTGLQPFLDLVTIRMNQLRGKYR